MEPIRSLDNPAVRELKRLLEDARARRESGQAVAEGPHLVGEALAAGAVLELWASPEALEGRDAPRLTKAASAAGLGPRRMEAGVIKRILGLPAPQGWLARVRCQGPAWPSAPELSLALDGIQDPGNVGTLLRNAWAAGAAVLLGPGCADPWSPKVLRASAGAAFHVPHRACGDLAAELRSLRGAGIRVWAASPKAARGHWDAALSAPACLVLGAEGPGLSAEVEAACDEAVRIAQPGGSESLNVAVSGAILLFEALRQRRKPGSQA